MAERIKDEGDRKIEAMFAATPLPDDGFSDRIIGKIRRRIWIRRLTLPLAAIIGGAIAIKPLSALAIMLVAFLRSLPLNLVENSMSWLPSLPMIGLGGMLLFAMLLGIRMLEE